MEFGYAYQTASIYMGATPEMEWGLLNNLIDSSNTSREAVIESIKVILQYGSLREYFNV